jgi:hypothetical protein
MTTPTIASGTGADFADAFAVSCPECGAPANKHCRYVEGAKHNGWAHDARYYAAEGRNP